MKIGALKAMILLNGVKEIRWCYLRSSWIWVKFFTVNVLKKSIEFLFCFVKIAAVKSTFHLPA